MCACAAGCYYCTLHTYIRKTCIRLDERSIRRTGPRLNLFDGRYKNIFATKRLLWGIGDYHLNYVNGARGRAKCQPGIGTQTPYLYFYILQYFV